MGAHSFTFAATIGRQNHVEVMHLHWDLEGVFHKKRWSNFGLPFPILIELGDFLSSMQFFPTFFGCACRSGQHFKDSEVI